MRIVKARLAYGYKLTLIVRCTRRLRIPLYLSGPQDVAFAVAHTVDVALQLLVGVDGYGSCKFFVRVNGGVFIALSPLRVGCSLQQTIKYSALNVLSVTVVLFNSPQSAIEYGTYN